MVTITEAMAVNKERDASEEIAGFTSQSISEFNCDDGLRKIKNKGGQNIRSQKKRSHGCPRKSKRSKKVRRSYVSLLLHTQVHPGCYLSFLSCLYFYKIILQPTAIFINIVSYISLELMSYFCLHRSGKW